MNTPPNLLQLAANTVRALAMDGVQKANSGHPGMPMGMADAATVLWTRFLKFDPTDPLWPDRDRFVLSAGHGSMLLYSLLHLTGYNLPLEQLQNFRQWGSKTPGHPERGLTPGVETTTGPLGQGLANAVGLALAERCLAARFNVPPERPAERSRSPAEGRPNFEIVNHHTYVIAGDGDLMEGVSHEACALAGHLGLGKLIVLYDDNGISIDGPTSLSFSEDVLARFAAYGWHTRRVDGHDPSAIESAIRAAVLGGSLTAAGTGRPSLIACKTHIGFGSPNRQDTNKAHGEPLGADEVRLAKECLGQPPDAQFHIPAQVYDFMRQAGAKGAATQAEWNARFARYDEAYPDLAAAFRSAMRGELPLDWDGDLPTFQPPQSATTKPLATRAASGAVLDALAPRLPTLIGGSADLTPSNNTLPRGEQSLSRDDFSGRYIRFGVREHGMGSILNGLALHGGLRPYGGTFLVFSDYMRPALRMAAMMGLPVVFVFTHDSIGLGEDGPTHQPIEHLAALRAIPNLYVFRPADAAETALGWRMAIERAHGRAPHHGPTALVLTRQAVPILGQDTSGALRGGYVLADAQEPQAILIATGSEVHIALEAQKLLAAHASPVRARVVSLPCWELFEAQPEEYQESVLPSRVRARVAVEAGATLGWSKYVGLDGAVIGLDRFGASAPYQTLYRELGLTAEAVAEAAYRVSRIAYRQP